MAKIIINSSDSFGEIISQKMIAQKTVLNGFTIFSYDNRYGKGEIRISPYSTEILKFSDIESRLIIKPESKTNFIFNAPYLKMNFTVFCKKYIYSENKLTIAYVIYDNDIEINQLEIEIIEAQ